MGNSQAAFKDPCNNGGAAALKHNKRLKKKGRSKESSSGSSSSSSSSCDRDLGVMVVGHGRPPPSLLLDYNAGNRAGMIPDGAFYDSTTNYNRRSSADHTDSDPVLLIAARKPPNPNKQIPELRELQRELAFNNKMGINVLGQKTELQKAMEKMRKQVFTKQELEEKKKNRSDLELKLEKRQLRLKEYENVMTDQPGQHDMNTSSFPAVLSANEFHRIHAKVNGRFASATTS
ncbi:hypothetical protein BV898_05124 [Hypsibius exemplaris]|uniref:Uncharacterized protein n=1 Tax=Hypsibius exemplaris TaxID=2072580 RepID=A0A1W0X0T4_HYPEX|nr:hypothetical protein BV898_05124 [Hypsibius exemplaris]